MGTGADAMESLSGARLQPRPPLARALHPLFFSRHAPDGEVCGAQDEIKEVANMLQKLSLNATTDSFMFKAAEASVDDLTPMLRQECEEYLNLVKCELGPEIHDKFCRIFVDFKSHAIDTQKVIERVSALFAGHQLILGFNKFLPAEVGDSRNSLAQEATLPLPSGRGRWAPDEAEAKRKKRMEDNAILATIFRAAKWPQGRPRRIVLKQSSPDKKRGNKSKGGDKGKGPKNNGPKVLSLSFARGAR